MSRTMMAEWISTNLSSSSLRATLVAVAAGCFAFAPVSAAELKVLFGTHTAAPGKGFSISNFDSATGALSKPVFLQEVPAPAYFVITRDGRFVYTCNSNGFVSSFAIEAGTEKLTLLNKVPSGGGDPSYLSLDQTGKYIFVANYDGGNIAAWALKPDGSLGERTAFLQHTGHSVHPQRQTHAYAHSIIPDPTNRFVLAADLGLDKLFVYRFNVKDGSLSPNDPPFASVTAGSGARHVVFHPNGRWVYLVAEMGSTIFQFEWDKKRGALKEVQSISALPVDFHGLSTCAELKVHPSGKFLYVSNRGHDSIGAFSLNRKTGRLTSIQHIPSGGRTPRNFEFDPSGRWMVVTNHGTNTAAVFSIDQSVGMLKLAGAPIDVPSPFCPRFLQR